MKSNGNPTGRSTAGPILAAVFLFNLGQGALRLAMPLYLQHVFTTKYRMVTLIPVAFGLGRWVASLPTGVLSMRLGRRPLMVSGLLLMACVDIASVLTSAYAVFLTLRGVGGAGWAMFGTIATAVMVDAGAERRGQSVSLLFMSETLGLLVGSIAGGWLYEGLAVTTPFFFEAACMVVAAVLVAGWPSPATARHDAPRTADQRVLGTVLRIPGVLVMSATNAVLIGLQTGVLVFLFPLYLANRVGMTPGTTGLLVSLSVLGRLPALWLGGSLSDRHGRLRVLVPGLACYAVLFGILPFLTHPIMLGVWSLAGGAALGVVAPIPTAVVADQVPSHLHDVAVGWLRTMTDTGHLVGPLVMGPLADSAGLSAPFFAGAALLLATMWQCRRSGPGIAAPRDANDKR